MTESQDTDAVESGSLDAVQPPAPDPAAELAHAGTPGSALRMAREASGRSIADVVQVIRFSARQIEALERDDYASLPGSTAVRGLVRNYARFLKLDAAPLLAQLDPAVPVPEADVRPPANMGEAEQHTIAERIPLGALAGVAALTLLALVAYWYLALPGAVSQPREPETPSMTLSRPAAPVEAVSLVAPAPAVVAGNEVVAPSALPSPPPGDGLRVEFDDRSWVEIRDTNQKIVFVGEYPAGTRQNVDGKPPFQIWIGKASGVRLFMGERSIDLKPHTREEVARFTLE